MYDDDVYGSNNKRKTILLLVVAVFVIFIGALYLFLPRGSKQNNPADNTTNTTNNTTNQQNNNSNNTNSNNTNSLPTLDIQEIAVSATLIGADSKKVYFKQSDKIFQADINNVNNKKQIAYNIDYYKFNLNNNQIFLRSQVNKIAFIYDTYNQKLIKLDLENVVDVVWWKLNPYYLIKNDLNNTYRLYDPAAKRDVFQANDPVIYALKDLLLYNERTELNSDEGVFRSINPISRIYGSDFKLGSNIFQLNEGLLVAKGGDQYQWYKDTKSSPDNLELNKSPESVFLNLGDGNKSLAYLNYNKEQKSLEIYNQELGSAPKLVGSYQMPSNFDQNSLISSKLFSTTNKIIEINNTVYLAK